MEQRTLARHEMIGLGVTIVAARNSSLVGTAGTIVDETRNTLILEKNGHTLKKVPKEQVVLRVKIDDSEVIIDGKSLVGRPEDRLKKKVKR